MTVAVCVVLSLTANHLPAMAADPEPPMKSAECRVARVGDVPTFIINGEPHSGMCYSSYDCSSPNLPRRVKQFAEARCDIFNFVVEISGYGYSRPMWVGPGEWDFSHLDERARTILAEAPNGWLLPRIYIDAPAWWCEQNRGELMVLSNGSTSFGEKLFALARPGDYPSLASGKWRAAMADALETVIDHIEHSEYGARVLGYQLSGQKTEEWYHWSMNAPLLGDYSSHMERAFREWLRARYGSDEALRSAWHREGATIDAAAIPSQAARFGEQTRTFRDPLREADVIDFHRFWSDIMADTITYFAHVVKEKTEGRKVVGAFYAYTFEFTELGEDAGHLAVGKLLESPDIDFIMAPSSYFDRNLPGKPYFRAPVASLAHHGKLFWDDFDQASFKWYDKLKQDPNLAQWEWQMGLTKTAEEFVWMNRREVGMALTQGAQLAHFDIHGGYYEDAEVMAGVKRLGEVRREALKWRDRGSVAQVLAVVDEDSEHYVSFRNPLLTALLSAQMAELGFVAPYDAVLLSDLSTLDTSRYRLAVVLNAFRLDDGQREVVRRKLAGGGRTVVWLYAPGYFRDGAADVGNMQDLTGIAVVAGGPAPEAGEAACSERYGGGAVKLQVPRGERFRVEDVKAEAIARSAGGEVVAARRRLRGWTSVYSAAAPVPAALLKFLAAGAGVHLYDTDPTHLVFANRHFLTIAANAEGGEATISLPRKTTVTDLASGELLCRDARRFTVQLRPKEVRVLGLR